MVNAAAILASLARDCRRDLQTEGGLSRGDFGEIGSQKGREYNNICGHHVHAFARAEGVCWLLQEAVLGVSSLQRW